MPETISDKRYLLPVTPNTQLHVLLAYAEQALDRADDTLIQARDTSERAIARYEAIDAHEAEWQMIHKAKDAQIDRILDRTRRWLWVIAAAAIAYGTSAAIHLLRSLGVWTP